MIEYKIYKLQEAISFADWPPHKEASSAGNRLRKQSPPQIGLLTRRPPLQETVSSAGGLLKRRPPR